ncbi:HpcH/HpaI aldolase/citrate lyase family protein [Streptomyces sp. NPDC059477]|uniref:HpcH/HpaI aldolase/citrate lyase family protein n=1 Tax=Streptomyces sp. NPDC059477 TaxID=3346847 RepID=UPI0036C6E804
MRRGHWRSLLICPGDRPDRIAKAIAARPGGVIVDLEDAVHPSQREKARRSAAQALAASDDPEVTHLIRVNPVGTTEIARDLATVIGPWLDAVIVPKVAGPDDIENLAEQLRAAELKQGLRPGTIGIVPVIEDCSALRYVDAIACAAPTVVAMSFAGAEAGDFMADLGGRWTPDGLAFHYPKSRFVCDVRAAGDLPAIDGPSMNLQDPSVWKSECDIARTLGFDGKVAIHPKQLDTINGVFMPSAAEIADAHRVVAALDEAARSGVGVTTDRGRMLDPANGQAARRLLRRAGESPRLGSGSA